MKQEQLDILRGAREIISDPSRWCQGTLENGAGQVCALGAIARSSDAVGRRYAEDDVMRAVAQKMLREKTPALCSSIHPAACVNDFMGHEATLEMFDTAICVVENGGSAEDVKKT